jgi:hypothetical protein
MVKMNSHLLQDGEMDSVMQALFALLQTSQHVADLFEERQAMKDEEEVAQRLLR